MAIDRIFAAAYIDNGNVHKILGVKLRPFCAWHLFQLQIVESPFLSAGEVFLFHLRRAVGICRLRFPESRTKLPFFPLVVNKKKLHKEVENFLLYLGDYIQKPDYSVIPPDEFRKSKRTTHLPSPAPEVVQLAFEAAHGANISIHDAWNMPIGQAYIAQAMYLKQHGIAVDFMNEEERQFQASILEHSGNGQK